LVELLRDALPLLALRERPLLDGLVRFFVPDCPPLREALDLVLREELDLLFDPELDVAISPPGSLTTYASSSSWRRSR
jgi:hypothetical protein